MKRAQLLDLIARGRTDLMIALLALPDWREALDDGPNKALSWCVYYNDLTAIRAILAAGGDLSSISLDDELGHAAFFGWWKIADFLIKAGADPNARVKDTGETPLHGALSKAGRPAYLFTVRVLVENGADVNAKTIPGAETGAFMRDVRTKGETPLHRAAAYADAATIAYLLDRGADRTARDAHGDSPLSWASAHLRPGAVLDLLQFPPHAISAATRDRITSDHGAGWGNGMERNQMGDYLAESRGAF
jgi:ankyrin repeat protein